MSGANFSDIHWVKEHRSILNSVTKCLSGKELDAEVEGYRACRAAGLPAPNLLSVTKDTVTMEYVSGVSCIDSFRALYGHGREDIIRDISDQLISDTAAFQGHVAVLSGTTPYDIPEKVLAAAHLLEPIDPIRASQLTDAIGKLSAFIPRVRLIPFRDASPRNIIFYKVAICDLEQISSLDLITARRHIDFRSLCELTSRFDDIVSIVFHPFIPSDYRTRVLSNLAVTSLDRQELSAIKVVRLARFWGRREYYRRHHPDLFTRRYLPEEVSFYYDSLMCAIDDILNL